MRPKTWSAPLATILLASAFLIAGCGGSNNALAPRFQPEVANNVDNFQFQATGLTGVTQTLTYTWRNTGTRATVDQSCAITGGTATVSLSDSTGAQQYSRSLADGGSFPSSTGLPGGWTVRVTLSGVKGTLNFRAQKL